MLVSQCPNISYESRQIGHIYIIRKHKYTVVKIVMSLCHYHITEYMCRSIHDIKKFYT